MLFATVRPHREKNQPELSLMEPIFLTEPCESLAGLCLVTVSDKCL